MKHLKRWGILAGIAAVLLSAGTVAARPLAHERIVSGDYAFVLGWLEEPPVVGLKNAALVEVRRPRTISPWKARKERSPRRLSMAAKARNCCCDRWKDQPGVYVGDFIPTRRGTYTLKLGGTINGQSIEVSNEIEEVGSLDSLTFPEPQADLQKSIEALQSELSTTRIFAVVGAALGTIGLVLAGVALGRSRK